MYEYRKLNPEQRQKLIEERLQKGYPRHSPPHLIENQPFYLLTAACYEHQHRLHTVARRQPLFQELSEVLIQEEIEIIAWVILPNHYHILTSTVDFQWLGKQLRLIHGRTAHQWNLEDQVKGKLWCCYSDRAIRNNQHYYQVINYIHYNPVKHGFTDSPYYWENSSVHRYLEEKGRDWLRNCWVEYPVRDYGQKWDIC
ncbi:conserved hypothetical protein [Planktothrix sp. PCC 11201]|uniref:REP-associated tyrosine transposase n=1 Tax=Planktothrix sp. PCC 11201 TaxID=1729650 RepID=UPI000916B97D|nr:transposase [Planktothrix sp. PCC 11201]SKB15415.1 conserved hypothetical protein [Planktothrix sp. PCC 11201]